MRVRRWLIVVLVLAGSGGGGPAMADLTTFGYGNARLGASPVAAAGAVPPNGVRRLRVAWRVDLASPDGRFGITATMAVDPRGRSCS